MADILLTRGCPIHDELIVRDVADGQPEFEVVALEHAEKELVDSCFGFRVKHRVCLKAQVHTSARAQLVEVFSAFKLILISGFLDCFDRQKYFGTAGRMFIVLDEELWVQINMIDVLIKHMNEHRALIDTVLKELKNKLNAPDLG